MHMATAHGHSFALLKLSAKPQRFRTTQSLPRDPETALNISQVGFRIHQVLPWQAIQAKPTPIFKGNELYGLLDNGPTGGTNVQMSRKIEAKSYTTPQFEDRCTGTEDMPTLGLKIRSDRGDTKQCGRLSFLLRWYQSVDNLSRSHLRTDIPTGIQGESSSSEQLTQHTVYAERSQSHEKDSPQPTGYLSKRVIHSSVVLC